MKGRMKQKIRVTLLIVAAVVAASLVVVLVAGRMNTVPILIVAKEGLDITKPLDEQMDFFKTEEILKSEMDFFNGSVVMSIEELEGQKTTTGVSAGSPILRSSLYEKNSGGNFALGFPKGFTVRPLPAATIGLPPMAVGDKINVGLTYKMTKIGTDGQQIQYDTSTIVLENLEIVNVVGTDVYVKVTLEEGVIFEVLSTIGKMYYQLPGQKGEEGTTIDREGNITITSDEILRKIQNGEILNTDINLKDLLEKGLEGVQEGEVVQPEDVTPGTDIEAENGEITEETEVKTEEGVDTGE